MRAHKLLAAGVAVLALGVAFLSNGSAADDDKGLRAAMDKLVGTAAKSPDDLRKEGVSLAKEKRINNDTIKEVMDFLGPREDGGWGVGKAGTIKPAGIQNKIRALGQHKPALTN